MKPRPRSVVPLSLRNPLLLATALLLGSGALVLASGQQEEALQVRAERADDQELSVTSHQIRVNGQVLPYTATAGYLPLHDEHGRHLANVFFTAYTRDGVRDPADRPITFSFNGGPGAASVWLHLGLGPRRVQMADPGESTRFRRDDPLPPPFELVDNEYTWLEETDLVFVDPVSTGYSRAAVGQDPAQFHGYVQDVEYLSEFIRLFVSRSERWASPKFLVGESYGTTRVSGIADHLQQRHGMHLNGVMLVSAVLNFQTLRPHIGNDLPYLLFFPSFAATAWYHDRLDSELQAMPLEQFARRVENFVANEYSVALFKGDAMSSGERGRVVERMARYSGLSPEYIEQTNLRLTTGRFAKELRRDDRRTVGRLDSRFVGIDRDAAGEAYEFDPSYGGAIMGPFTATLNHYLRTELDYTNDLNYEIRAGARVRPWDYSNVQNQYLNVAEELRRAMSENPYLRLYVASGYYDLATPYYAMDYTLAQMQLDESLRNNVEVHYYQAGHMMYIHEPDLVKMKDDISGYFRRALQDSGL